jgi:hypothetical protein
MKNMIGIAQTLLVITTIIGMTSSAIFLKTLKNRETEEWKKLGSPEIFSNNGFRESINLFLYIFKGNFKKSQDEQVRSIGWCSRILLNIHIIVFLAFVFLIFFNGLTK